MSYEEEFDKIVRQKAGQAEYQFNEGDWQKAGAMLDARNAAQKSGMTKWIVPALFTVLTGVTAWLYFSPGTSASDELAVNPTVQSQNTITVQEESTKGKTESTRQQISAGDQITEKHIETANVQEIESHPTTEHVAATPQKQISRTSKPTEPLLTNDTKASAKQLESKDMNTSNGGDAHSLPPAEPIAAMLPPVVAAGAQPGNATEIKQEPAPEQSPATAATESQNSETSEVLATDLLGSRTSNLLRELTDPELLVLPFTMLKRYDDDYYQKTRHRQYLTIDGGGTYFFGWDTPNGKDGKGADYYVGANYGYYLSRKISASVGLQMYSVSNITQPFYNAQQKSYGFGYTSSYTSITTDHMVFGSVPLRLNYHFTKFSAIGAGFNAGYLLQNHSRIDTYGVSDGIKGPVTSTGNYTVYESTSNINLMGSVFMSTRVHQRVGLNAEFVYGFTDLFKNNANVSNSEKTMGVRFGITYYIFEK